MISEKQFYKNLEQSGIINNKEYEQLIKVIPKNNLLEDDYINKNIIKIICLKVEEIFDEEDWLVEHDLNAIMDDEIESKRYYKIKQDVLKDLRRVFKNKLLEEGEK